MSCKCNLKLEDKKISLNIDLDLYKKLSLLNNDVFLPGISDPNDIKIPRLLPIDGFDNIYATRRASYEGFQLQDLKYVIDRVKNDIFLCNCLKSKIDMIKFVLYDERDIKSLSGPAVAAHPRCENIILINAGLNKLLGMGIQQISSTIAHEITHLLEACKPCRSKNNNDLFDSQVNKLYNQFKSIYNDIKNFNNDFTNLLVRSNTIKLNDKYKNIINNDILYANLDYALTNKQEFLAEFASFFCYELPYNNNLIRSDAYTADNPAVTQENLRSLYISQFNQRYSGIIQQVCELFNKVQSDPNNCSENTTENIEAYISIQCNSSILDGINLCCNGYDIYLTLSNDSGCCDSDESDKSYRIQVGALSLINSCNCNYLFNGSDINLNDFLQLINNCCNSSNRYPINENDKTADDFKKSISDQIFNAIRDAFGDGVMISKNRVCY